MLAVLISLYLGTSWILGAMYGPSFGVAQGNPGQLPPDEPSVQIPLIAPYLPILIPGFLLALFLLTPLRYILDGKPEKKDDQAGSETTAENDTNEQSGENSIDS